jgi:VWFA-related protein
MMRFSGWMRDWIGCTMTRGSGTSRLFQFLFTICCPFLWLSATAQQDTAVLKLQSRLVVLDVTVLDKNQQVVRDLKREDFRVYEAGEQQTIRNFEGFSLHPLPATVTKDTLHGTADLQRLIPQAPVTVLVLDELNTNFEDSAFARTSIKKYLMSQPETLTQPTIFLVATDTSFELAQDYTLDRQQLLNALAHLKPGYPFGLMRTGGSPEGRAIRFAQTLASLQQVAQATSGHAGRKNLIWVGRGFGGIDLTNSPDHQVELVKGAAERTLNLLRDSHVTLYTVDPTLSTTIAAQVDSADIGVDDTAFAAEVHNAKDPFDGTVSFNTFAPETGGRAFSLNNDLDNEIRASVQDGSAYYTMSYVPTGSSDAEKPYRQIIVRVGRPGLTVITRKGYFTATPPLPVRSPTQALKATGFDMGTAVMSNITYTGLGVLAAPGPAVGDYVVQIATNDLTWQSLPDGSSSAHVILAAVALDAKGKPVAKAGKDATAKLSSEIPLSSIPFTVLKISLNLPPGALRIRIVVHDETSGKIGTADVQVH